MLLFVLPGSLLFRFAERQLLELLFQLPRRAVASWPRFGPHGDRGGDPGVHRAHEQHEPAAEVDGLRVVTPSIKIEREDHGVAFMRASTDRSTSTSWSNVGGSRQNIASCIRR